MLMPMTRFIKVRDFSKTPGTGLDGERFRREWLEPEFEQSLQENSKLIINLDKTAGYGTSWLKEVFGGLARDKGKENVLKILDFESSEEPYLIEDIKGYINSA